MPIEIGLYKWLYDLLLKLANIPRSKIKFDCNNRFPGNGHSVGGRYIPDQVDVFVDITNSGNKAELLVAWRIKWIQKELEQWREISPPLNLPAPGLQPFKLDTVSHKEWRLESVEFKVVGKNIIAIPRKEIETINVGLEKTWNPT